MLAIHAEEGEDSRQPSKPQPTPSPAQSFHEEQKGDCYLKEESQEVRIEEKIKNSRVKTLQDWDEGITHVEGDAEQVVIAAAEVVKLATLVQMSETSKKTQKQLDDERAGLEEAMRLQAKQEAKHVEQIHLDRLLAQRMQEEQEMTKQQKKRQAEVLESAKYYTEED
ncbi:hypothetical protein Tco_0045123 [Tanacetum coccineum]